MSLELKSLILTEPLAESITRRRTFSIAQRRDDFRDAQTQFLLLLTQLHDESFTGRLSFDFLNGNINVVSTEESQKIK